MRKRTDCNSWVGWLYISTPTVQFELPKLHALIQQEAGVDPLAGRFCHQTHHQLEPDPLFLIGSVEYLGLLPGHPHVCNIHT